MNQKRGIRDMSRVVFFAVLLLLLCSCNIYSPGTDEHTEQISEAPSIITNDGSIDNNDKNIDNNNKQTDGESIANSDVGYFSEEEIEGFPLLRSDWSKAQMEGLGLHKETHDAYTFYFDDNIRYTFFEDARFGLETPAVVDVYGQQEGPRCIKIGDSFNDVLRLFPVEKDWKTSAFGEFYGQIHETEEWEPFGSVGVIGDNEKTITVSPTGHAPFLRIFFTDDKVTHYTFYLVDC